MTDAERRLWSRLRGEQLGVKFRRQHPLGGYVLDFACLDPQVVIEVDGSQHLGQTAYDTRRSAWLADRGFRVVRFWANEVLSETEAVVNCIADVLARGPHPNPPPAGEGVKCSPPPAGEGAKRSPPSAEDGISSHKDCP